MNISILVFLPLLGAALSIMTGSVLRRPRLASTGAVLAAVATAAGALSLAARTGFGGPVRIPWIPGVTDFILAPDTLSMTIVMVVTLIGGLIVIYSLEYMKYYDGLGRYWSLLLVFIGAMCGLVLSGSMLQMFFFWEIVGVCSYSLIGFEIGNPKAGKSGLKAFITTKIGDVGLLAGILLLYSASPSKSFEFSVIQREAAQGLIGPRVLLLAGFLLLAGAVGKSAQLPLHVWLPDAMEAPTSVSALIHAATMVNSGVYLMARMQPVFGQFASWTAALMWIGTLTALAGSLMACFARDLKRLLAYSTISQLGIMMFGVAAGSGLASSLHLANHAVFKALLFLAAGAVIHETGTREIAAMRGLFKKMPVTAVAFGAGVLALCGFPPFNGFFSKEMVLEAGISGGFLLASVVVTAASTLTVFYALNTFGRIFLGDVSPAAAESHEVRPAMLAPLVVLAAGTLTSWVAVRFVSGGELGAYQLLNETRQSSALPLGITALCVGTLMLLAYGRQPETLSKGLAEAAQTGFYFDQVYSRIMAALGRAGGAAAATLEYGMTDGITNVLASVERAAQWVSDGIDSGIDGLIALVTYRGEGVAEQATDGIDASIDRAIWSVTSVGEHALRRVADAIDRALSRSGNWMVDEAYALGRKSRSLHTGDANHGLVGVLAGLVALTVIVLLERGL